MFAAAFAAYQQHASDFDELQPISCTGRDTWGTCSLSLIDSLDTLLLMGNLSEFERVSQLVQRQSFDRDVNVSVFETNIRVVGGLLSAHLLLHRSTQPVPEGWPCAGPLLHLAEDVARRLLPAFQTATGMPYGTVNLRYVLSPPPPSLPPSLLNRDRRVAVAWQCPSPRYVCRYGVPVDETQVTCCAGVGTFVLEFATLSRLTGDPVFEETALRAVESLHRTRSSLDLPGNHINITSGSVTRRVAPLAVSLMHSARSVDGC